MKPAFFLCWIHLRSQESLQSCCDSTQSNEKAFSANSVWHRLWNLPCSKEKSSVAKKAVAWSGHTLLLTNRATSLAICFTTFKVISRNGKRRLTIHTRKIREMFLVQHSSRAARNLEIFRWGFCFNDLLLHSVLSRNHFHCHENQNPPVNENVQKRSWHSIPYQTASDILKFWFGQKDSSRKKEKHSASCAAPSFFLLSDPDDVHTHSKTTGHVNHVQSLRVRNLQKRNSVWRELTKLKIATEILRTHFFYRFQGIHRFIRKQNSSRKERTSSESSQLHLGSRIRNPASERVKSYIQRSRPRNHSPYWSRPR